MTWFRRFKSPATNCGRHEHSRRTAMVAYILRLGEEWSEKLPSLTDRLHKSDHPRRRSGAYASPLELAGCRLFFGAAVSGMAIANTESAITAAAPDVRKAAE